MLQTRKNILDKARTELADSVNASNKVYTNEELSALITDQQSSITSVNKTVDILNNSINSLNTMINDMRTCTDVTTVNMAQFVDSSNFTAGTVSYYKCGNTVTVQINVSLKQISGHECFNITTLPYTSKIDIESPVHGSYGRAMSGSITLKGQKLAVCQYNGEQVVDSHGLITFAINS